MELKVPILEHVAHVCERFNRTFMELKAFCWRRGNARDVFQSHLYGIERNKITTPHRRNFSFNRTFMELKVELGNVEALKDGRFQSHLYGIESCNALGKYGRLLRFNRTFMELKEHGNRVARLDTLVSIAPLWN